MPSPPTQAAEFFERFLPERVGPVLAAEPGLAGVQAAAEVTLTGAGGGTWTLALANGRIEVRTGPSDRALVRIRQTVDDWRLSVERGTGGIEAFLGTAAATGARRPPLTPQKLERLRNVKGTLAFDLQEVDPGRTLRTVAHFGPPPIKDQPDCTIQIRASDYAEMASGKLHPQAAFMAGKIKLLGDLNLAMQLAMLMGPA